MDPVTVWAAHAGQPPPWPVLAVLGIAAAAMFARRTWPVPAALVTSVAYVISVQSGGFNPHGSSPGTIAETIGTGNPNNRSVEYESLGDAYARLLLAVPVGE